MRSIIFLLTFFVLQYSNAQRKGYWQQKVDYQIQVDVNEKNYQYDGKMQLKYTNNSDDDLQKVYFHLYFNAFQPGSMMDYRLANIKDPDRRMVTNKGSKEKPIYESRIARLQPHEIGYQKIKSITYNGKKVNYMVDGTILEVSLPTPLRAGTSAIFLLDWQAQVPAQIRRSGRQSSEGVEFSMTQWYPKMAHYDEFGWHLDEYIGREFVAPFGNFDVQINIHKDYIVGASGVLQNPNEVKGYVKNAKPKVKNGKVTWHYKAENIHDFAWGADPDYIVEKGKSKGGVELYFVYQPGPKTTQNWHKAINITADFFDFVGDRFGAYPWPTYTIVQGGDGGMEYGTATLITGERSLDSLIGVIFHEAAHSWYQHLFGINETHDEWFDEGFTSYIEQLGSLNWKKETILPNPNPEAYEGYFNLAKSGLEEPASLLADYYNTNFAYSLQAYYKGQVMAIQLGYIIGEEALKETFKQFYKEWKFKHPTPNDFKRTAEKVSGINLKWYFNLFINTTRFIDYGIEKTNTNELKISNLSDFAMPIDVLVEYQDGSKELFYIPLREMRGEKKPETFALYQSIKRTVLTDWFWTNPTYTIKTKKEIKKAEIDPTKRLADVNPNNNITQ
ncbi:M1 family metallopeptidase [uncultured Weeksella sp.]|uniref:M1 family metallopeptidase n=1 Tax=uncultured Weeksella sp. TaxID=1161389 RepID=UPI00259BEE19|nr:M1 family metallopeptidase [uncultured Weeksella sp.]